MCQFNLMVIKKESDPESLKSIMLENGFGYLAFENQSLTNQLGTDIQQILTTSLHCDCGSILGIEHHALSNDLEKEKRKLRKKKWSEAKIERYLNNRLIEHTKKEYESELGNQAEANKWIKIISILVEQKGKVGILFHQFGGSIGKEEIEILKINRVSIEFFNEELLRNFKENQLNWIHQ